jgi:uncharacterized protein (TIGR03905 family)
MLNNERGIRSLSFERLFILIKKGKVNMMEKKTYITSGTCSRKIEFDYEDGKIYNLRFEGGCNGNLKAISKLVEGKDMAEVKRILQGNTCGPRPTSCADQLARAIGEVLDNE